MELAIDETLRVTNWRKMGRKGRYNMWKVKSQERSTYRGSYVSAIVIPEPMVITPGSRCHTLVSKEQGRCQSMSETYHDGRKEQQEGKEIGGSEQQR